MKRLKLIFHVIYVLIALVVFYFSIDILLNTEQYLSKIKLSSYIKFPRYVMIVFLIISLLMLGEFILERFNMYKLKSGVAGLKAEITELKAKLYDKAQEEPILPAANPTESDEADIEEEA